MEKDKETIIPEIELATRMGYAMLAEAAKDRTVTEDQFENLLQVAAAFARMAFVQAKREAMAAGSRQQNGGC